MIFQGERTNIRGMENYIKKVRKKETKYTQYLPKWKEKRNRENRDCRSEMKWENRRLVDCLPYNAIDPTGI